VAGREKMETKDGMRVRERVASSWSESEIESAQMYKRRLPAFVAYLLLVRTITKKN
jgi:hypothetical protein